MLKKNYTQLGNASLNTPEGILCANTHEWVLEDNNQVLIGITDWQCSQMGDIVFLELPEVESKFSKNEIFATVESVRNACELYMPVSGKITEVNEKLINSPELINEDCYTNWLVKAEPDNFQEDSEDLMEYIDYIDEVS